MPAPAVRIACLAGAVRIVHLLALRCLDWLLPDYDSSAQLSSALLRGCSAYSTNAVSASTDTAAASFHTQPAALQSLMVWDSVFFQAIACHGYEFEQYYAFSPLLPVVAGALGPTLFPAAAVFISNAAFVVASALLYQLSHEVLRGHSRAAALACLFFIFSPASVFHTVAYTESLFCCLTFAGLWALRCRKSMLLAVLMFAAAGAARSNGVINAGFLLHEGLHRACAWRSKPSRAALHLVGAFVAAAAVALPFLAHQYVGWLAFCRPLGVGAGEPLTARPWCSQRWPYIYGFVQGHYWGVGFLRYFTLQQLPNFLLAAPALAISAGGCYSYVRAYPLYFLSGSLPALWRDSSRVASSVSTSTPHPGVVVADDPLTSTVRHRGGSAPSRPPRDLSGRWASAGATAVSKRKAAAPLGGSHSDAALMKPFSGAPSRRQQQQQSQQQQHDNQQHVGTQSAAVVVPAAAGFLSAEVGVFIYPWAFCCVTATLVMNVQVATRFISFCPALYWYMAHLCLKQPSVGCGGHGWAPWLWWYCCSYIMVGSVLFPNFYPWT